jgi:DNA-binding winged helix-turn-helix (wHTH) protein
METPAQPDPVLRFGPFELNAAAAELRENGVVRRLPPQPFRVLLLLAERAGQTVTRNEIQRCLWGDRKYLDIEHGINFCISQIRSALRDPAELSRYVKTLPRRGYCFVAPVLRQNSAASDVAPSAAAQSQADDSARSPGRATHNQLSVAATAVVLLTLILVPMSAENRRVHPSAALTEKDFVVVADFSNATGEEVFDDSLRQALVIELRQSPFLNVLADTKVRETLKRMGRPDDQRMTPEIAREICLRTGSKAALDGKISKLGGHYFVSLNAIACDSGDALFNTQDEAAGRDDVLKTLNNNAIQLRGGLGESLRSLKRFDVPIGITTCSLEALKNYAAGLKMLISNGEAPSIPFFLRAIELDPNFSMAYASLASRYNNLNQPSLALSYATRAYELRDSVSERERLVITTRYLRLQGELEKLTQALDVWISEYPRDAGPHGSLGSNYAFMGEYAKALTEWQTAFRLSPGDVTMYENVGLMFLALNRPFEAQQALNSALTQHLDSGGLRWAVYYLGFIQNNPELMQQQAQWAVGKPGSEDILLSAQADTDAYFGRLGRARELSRRAVDSAIRSDYPEAAALWQVNAALRDAEFHEVQEVKTSVKHALALSDGRNVKVLAALALARIGDTDQAELITKQLQSDNPRNSAFTQYRLPSIQAAIALSQDNPRRALQYLEVIRPYELGQPSPSGLAPLYPAYLRGLAFLALHNGAAAVVEFNKLLDNPGVALNFAPAILAHLQLARAYVLANDNAKAMSAYENFLTLWKDADSSIAIHVVAKKEYARLRSGQNQFIARQPAARLDH